MVALEWKHNIIIKKYFNLKQQEIKIPRFLHNTAIDVLRALDKGGRFPWALLASQIAPLFLNRG